MMYGPLRGMAHWSVPVSTVTEFLPVLTLRVPMEEEAAPVESEIGPWNPAGRTVAKPLHLMEPSGQQASGQLCTGRLLPCALRLKLEPRSTVPCAQGTPQLMPVGRVGG
jgi:hypothetical protein